MFGDSLLADFLTGGFSLYFLMFIFYSFLGWIMEVIFTRITEGKWVNRGFLIGPICPIYGVGLLLITNLLDGYTKKPLVLFILAIFICMVLEYFTSYIMEKLFNARWWDYSDMKYNINGRICLETTIPFGLGGLFIMYVIYPLSFKVLDMFSYNTLVILAFILLILFLVDVIISFNAISKIKGYFLDKYKDDTEEVNKSVRDYLINLNPLTKRLMESFPKFRVRIKKIADDIKEKVIGKK